MAYFHQSTSWYSAKLVMEYEWQKYFGGIENDGHLIQEAVIPWYERWGFHEICHDFLLSKWRQGTKNTIIYTYCMYSFMYVYIYIIYNICIGYIYIHIHLNIWDAGTHDGSMKYIWWWEVQRSWEFNGPFSVAKGLPDGRPISHRIQVLQCYRCYQLFSETDLVMTWPFPVWIHGIIITKWLC